MKCMVDECAGPTVAKWLRAKDYDVVSIYDDFAGITDNEVLQKALAKSRIFITSDKDFGEMVFKKQQEYCGIVLLPLGDERPTNKMIVLEQALQNYVKDVWYNFTVVTETSIRIIKRSLS